MSFEISKNNQSQENKEEEPEILIYRGVVSPKEGAVGRWWSTNPYYAFRYSDTGEGELYYTKMKLSEIKRLSSDASLEHEFQNYVFKEDPPNIRKATNEQTKLLRSKIIFTRGFIGGDMATWPDDAVEIGKSIFDED